MPINPAGAFRRVIRPTRKIPRLPLPPGLAGAAGAAAGALPGGGGVIGGGMGGGGPLPVLPGRGLLPSPGLPGPVGPKDWMGGIKRPPPMLPPPGLVEKNLPAEDEVLLPKGPPMINIPPEEMMGPPGGVVPPPAPPEDIGTVGGGIVGGPGPMDLPPGGSTMPPRRARLGVFDPRTAKRSRF